MARLRFAGNQDRVPFSILAEIAGELVKWDKRSTRAPALLRAHRKLNRARIPPRLAAVKRK